MPLNSTDVGYVQEHLSALPDGLADYAKRIADALIDSETRHEASELLQGVCGALKSNNASDVVLVQLLRLVGNACFDHEYNRKACVTHDAPKSIVSLLQTARDSPLPPKERLALLRAATGALLNLTMDCEAAQAALLQTDFIPTAIDLVDPLPANPPVALYQPNSWATLENPDEQDALVRATISYWLLRILQELHHSTAQAGFVQKQTVSFLPLANLFIQVQSTRKTPAKTKQPDLSDMDCNILLLAAELLEAFLLDVDLARKQLGVLPVLTPLFDFVEADDLPTSWSDPEEQLQNWALIRSALVKGLTAVATEDSVMNACFQPISAPDNDMSQVLRRLRGWLGQTSKDDLLVCATVMLANLARSDRNSEILVQDYDIIDPLANILRSVLTSAERPRLQVLHGVTGLLKHLAVPAKNKDRLQRADLIPAAAVFLTSSYDVAQPVQVAAIGLIKNLCSNNLNSSIDFSKERKPLQDLIALSKRTDDVRLKTECIRVLVVLVRSLWTIPSRLTAAEAARTQLQSESEVYRLLASLIPSSAKYPMLINESVVTLSRLASTGVASGEQAALALLAPVSATAAGSESPPKANHSPLPPLSNLTLSEPPQLPTIASTLVASLSTSTASKLMDEIQSNVLSLLELLLGYPPTGTRAKLVAQIKGMLQEVVAPGTTASQVIKEKANRVLAAL